MTYPWDTIEIEIAMGIETGIAVCVPLLLTHRARYSLLQSAQTSTYPTIATNGWGSPTCGAAVPRPTPSMPSMVLPLGANEEALHALLHIGTSNGEEQTASLRMTVTLGPSPQPCTPRGCPPGPAPPNLDGGALMLGLQQGETVAVSLEVVHPDGGQAVHETDGGRSNKGPIARLAATLGHDLKVAGASIWAEGTRAIHLCPSTANPPQDGHGPAVTQAKVLGHADGRGGLAHPARGPSLQPQAGEVGVRRLSGLRDRVLACGTYNWCHE